MILTLAESGHPVFRATSPLSRGQLRSKGRGKLSLHFGADQETIKTVFRTITSVKIPLNDDDPAHKEFLLQRYGEPIEKLSQQDRLSKFCMDAGFLNVVEIGQFFMTKDTADLSQNWARIRSCNQLLAW